MLPPGGLLGTLDAIDATRQALMDINRTDFIRLLKDWNTTLARLEGHINDNNVQAYTYDTIRQLSILANLRARLDKYRAAYTEIMQDGIDPVLRLYWTAQLLSEALDQTVEQGTGQVYMLSCMLQAQLR
jgi:hypothetical protein